jgi:hypothetical protein
MSFQNSSHRKERVPIRKHTTAASGQAAEGGLKKTEEERVTPSPVRFPPFPAYLILCYR